MTNDEAKSTWQDILAGHTPEHKELTKVEALVKARELISDPAGWTQGQFFHTTGEEPLRSHEAAVKGYSTVCARCAWGALAEATQTHTVYEQVLELKAYIERVNGIDDLPNWQDMPERQHKEVLEAFDKAIRMARSEGFADALVDEAKASFL